MNRAKQCLILAQCNYNSAAHAAGLHHLFETGRGRIVYVAGRVSDLNYLLTFHNSLERAAVWAERAASLDPIAELRAAVHSTKMEALTVPGSESAKGCLAQTRCFFQHCIEHRREVTWRGVDNLQHLGGGGLLLQCLARLGQQPCVLHRNDRLRREILQQRYFLIGKGANLAASRDDPP